MYLPECRVVEGISNVPGGLKFYQECLRYHISTEMSPQEIHDVGLKEIASIQKRMDQVTAIQMILIPFSLKDNSKVFCKSAKLYCVLKGFLNSFSVLTQKFDCEIWCLVQVIVFCFLGNDKNWVYWKHCAVCEASQE